MFCEAVKVDMENSKKLSFHHTITSTLSLITVLFEDLFEAITLSQVAMSATTAVYDGLEILCALAPITGLRLSDK